MLLRQKEAIFYFFLLYVGCCRNVLTDRSKNLKKDGFFKCTLIFACVLPNGDVGARPVHVNVG